MKREGRSTALFPYGALEVLRSGILDRFLVTFFWNR